MEVTYIFGTDNPQETIQYADIGFLRRRVNRENGSDERKEVKIENGDQKINEFTICLNDKHISDLGKRLFKEVFGDRFLDVVLNPCMRKEKVAAFFILKLGQNLDKLLVKKRLNKKIKNEGDQLEFKKSVASKLDYLFHEDEVSILTAIIIFCHTNLSKYCLEALKLKNTSFKNNDLFTAVCCNGSKELFDVKLNA